MAWTTASHARSQPFEPVIRRSRAIACHACDLVGEPNTLMTDGRGYRRASGDFVDQVPQPIAGENVVDRHVEDVTIDHASDEPLGLRAVQGLPDHPLELRAVEGLGDEPRVQILGQATVDDLRVRIADESGRERGIGRRQGDVQRDKGHPCRRVFGSPYQAPEEA